MWEIRKMSTIRICFGFADNFLIGWSERRNNIGRNAESGKVLKSHKIENIETGQEETYESDCKLLVQRFEYLGFFVM